MGTADNGGFFLCVNLSLCPLFFPEAALAGMLLQRLTSTVFEHFQPFRCGAQLDMPQSQRAAASYSRRSSVYASGCACCKQRLCTATAFLSHLGHWPALVQGP